MRDIHFTRAGMRSMPFKLRAYSHAWLINNGWPSALPANMRPGAERVYPVVKAAVGISLNSNSTFIRPAVPIIRRAMENAVMDCHAEGKIEDALLVKDRMNDAKDYTIRKLFGRVSTQWA